jgi:hypothetical protein
LGLTNPRGFRIGFRDAKELNTLFQHRLVGTTPLTDMRWTRI